MKRAYWAAFAVFLLIPVVVVGGMGLGANINPEWALHTAHYGRNFRLLQDLRLVLLSATVSVSGLLWLSVFLLVLKGKGRSLWWGALSAFGPFGLAFLAMLNDAAPAPLDAYARWRASRGLLARAALEAVFFFAAWTISYEIILLWSDAQVLAQSLATGTPVAQIVAVRSASSGMWAFSEGIEQLFLIAVMYLAWPVCVNLAVRLKSALQGR